MTTTPKSIWLALVLLASAACARDSDPSGKPAPSPTTDLVTAPTAPADGVRYTQYTGTDVAGTVKTALAKARADRRTLLVYVGATWCEPCQRFHHAVDQGELDAAFPHLSILGFDADRDVDALAAAGYKSRLIPLFVLPGDDGRSSGKQIEGSVKGESAVSEITPRLRNLVASGS